MKGIWWEGIAAGGLCATIWIAIIAFISAMQPVQNTVTTEAVEMKLIKAIYVDEFARKFIKYGMMFILEESASEAALVGGINFPIGAAGGKKWINATDPTDIKSSLNKDTDERFPFNEETYFQWCTNTTDYITHPDCNPRKITSPGILENEDAHKEMIIESLEKSFSISGYLSKFALYAEMQPTIFFENYTITLDDASNPIVMEGDAHVIVKAGGAGVDSIEKVKTEDVDFPLWNMVDTARQFVDNDFDNELDSVLSGVSFCDPDYGMVNFTQDMNNTINSYGGYDFSTETIEFDKSGCPDCVKVTLLHTLNKTINNVNREFGFRTEFRYCT